MSMDPAIKRGAKMPVAQVLKCKPKASTSQGQRFKKSWKLPVGITTRGQTCILQAMHELFQLFSWWI